MALSAQAGMLPPRAPKRKSVVLDEDEYTAALDAIIERDFFPDVPKLRNQLEWLQAVRSGDASQIKQAQLNIARRRAGLTTAARPTDQRTQRTTPGVGSFRTPLMTPVEPASVARESLRGRATPLNGATPGAGSAAAAAGTGGVASGDSKAPGITLDEFFAKYQGEDNASFAQLQEDFIQRKRARLAHFYEDKNAPRPLLLEAGTEPPGSSTEPGGSGTSVAADGAGAAAAAGASNALAVWRHVPKNRLYYGYETGSVPLTERELAERVQGPPKQLRHANTRLPKGFVVGEEDEGQEGQPAGDAPPHAGAAATSASYHGLDTPGRLHPAAGSETPGLRAAAAAAVAAGTRGYRYLATPSPAPGVHESPFMTWGDIESTPLRLELEDDVLLDPNAHSGPQFSLRQERLREQVGKALAQKSAASLRKTATRATTPLLHALRSGGGRTVTPVPRGVGAAAAAGLLQTGSVRRPAGSLTRAGKTPDVDVQLRASYSQGAASQRRATPSSGLRVTPATARGAGQHTPVAGNAAATTGAGHAPKVAGNVTDGLLNL